jgi:peptide/nickel transport system ATP-binding protein
MVEEPPLIEAKDIYVGYKTYRGVMKVLNGVSFYINEGEKIGFIGEAGGGKTTLMKTILRILPPNATNVRGQVIYRGKLDLMRISEKEMKRIRRRGLSMIFQDPTSALNPVFKVGEQLMDIIKYSRLEEGIKLSKGELKEEALRLLEEVKLPDPQRVFDSYPFQLSGGMRQRVVIAMALVSARELLIADEPTTNLDVTIQDQILRLINEIVEKRKLSVILISHALGAVRKMTNRTYVLYAGDIVETAESNELFTNPLHPYTKALLEAAPKLTGEGIGKGIPGRIPDYVNPPSGCRFHPRCEYARERCKREKPPLVEVKKGHWVACWLYVKR